MVSIFAGEFAILLQPRTRFFFCPPHPAGTCLQLPLALQISPQGGIYWNSCSALYNATRQQGVGKPELEASLQAGKGEPGSLENKQYTTQGVRSQANELLKVGINSPPSLACMRGKGGSEPCCLKNTGGAKFLGEYRERTHT